MTTRWSITEYERCLPDGVFLKWSPSSKMFLFISKKEGVVLDKRPVETVLMWRRPDRVFASIARRVLRGGPR